MTGTVNQNACLKVDGSLRPERDPIGRGASRDGAASACPGRRAQRPRKGPPLSLAGGLGSLAAHFAPLGRVLWPARCLLCGDPGQDGRDLCARCDRELPWSGPACQRCALPLPAIPHDGSALCTLCEHEPPPLVRTVAAFAYAPPLDRLVPRLKFHGELAAGRLMGRLMAEALADQPLPDALVPVPLHRRRLRERGYNQAREIAAPLARQLGVRLRGDLLQRIRHTQPQSRLDADARQGNLDEAFTVSVRGPLPAHVVLVDDVMTTGATLHAAAWALREAGVHRVDAWVCARAL